MKTDNYTKPEEQEKASAKVRSETPAISFFLLICSLFTRIPTVPREIRVKTKRKCNTSE